MPCRWPKMLKNLKKAWQLNFCNMTRNELIELIKKKRSFLCVGLDSDIAKIPAHIIRNFEDPVFEFNRCIIDATSDFAVAYKPNVAFYESCGSKGWASLEKTINYLNANLQGGIFTIADAKRGDIGNTAMHYAKAFYETLGFDALTVNPYMGHDSLKPYLGIPGKWAIVLGLTSNSGAKDFQLWKPQLIQLLAKMGIITGRWKHFFEIVIEQCTAWGTHENTMFVAGATNTAMLSTIRQLGPSHFLLVPGVGAQGGNLRQVANAALTNDGGLLVNASRSIIFASSGENFEEAARQSAQQMQYEMQSLLEAKGIL